MAAWSAPALMAPRCQGRPGRSEVWYTTLTDPATGTGVWLHHEVVTPTGGGSARLHGWVAVFPPDGPPRHARFGPEAAAVTADVFDPAAPVGLSGEAAGFAWHLDQVCSAPPLHAFPAWTWGKGVLPATHAVPMPTAAFTGWVRTPEGELDLRDAPGATARIHGRGNALRWAWLHADLGGGDVLEVVAAVSAHPLLRRLRPLTFLRLRRSGRDWPARDTLLCAPAYRTTIAYPTWTTVGRVGDRRIAVEVTLDPARTLDLRYEGPDGRISRCRNSERASATITTEVRHGATWVPEGGWRLDGTAHAEVGSEATR